MLRFSDVRLLRIVLLLKAIARWGDRAENIQLLEIGHCVVALENNMLRAKKKCMVLERGLKKVQKNYPMVKGWPPEFAGHQ